MSSLFSMIDASTEESEINALKMEVAFFLDRISTGLRNHSTSRRGKFMHINRQKSGKNTTSLSGLQLPAMGCPGEKWTSDRRSKRKYIPLGNETLYYKNGYRSSRSVALLLGFYIVYCWICPLSFGLPRAHADQLCGAKLVDALRFLCGDRGIYSPIIRDPISGQSSRQPQDITVLCCEKSCTMDQLEQYCGKPVDTPEQRRRQHLNHLISLLPIGTRIPRRGRIRRPQRTPPARLAEYLSRDEENRFKVSGKTKPSRMSRRVERSINELFHEFSRLYKDYIKHAQEESHRTGIKKSSFNVKEHIQRLLNRPG